MSALTGRALQEQLSVIMEALAKAAVAEICGLVDEGYAALRLEISRSRDENRDLRKKLHLIESIVVRGSGGGQAAEPGPAAAAEDAEMTAARRDDHGGDGAAAAAVREELPDVVLIKDEDSDSSDSFAEDNKAPADGGAAAGGHPASSTPISRRMKRRWSGGGAGDRRSSSEQLATKTSKVPAGPQKKSVAVYTLDSPRSEPGGEELEAGEPVCSYSSQVDPGVQLIHQECSLVSPSTTRQSAYFANSSLLESPTNRAELDLSLTWTKQLKNQVTFTPFVQSENTDGDAFGIKLISVSGSTSTDCQLSESSNSAFEYDDADAVNFAHYRDQSAHLQLGGGGGGGRGKRFICSICNRTYATSQNLDVHMRIHTGERPFSCDQCGKKFTQSAHLKSHLSVHTGERPYACTLCSRSFIVKYSLKLHMKKCHPNIPETHS